MMADMPIYEFDGRVPAISTAAYLAPSAIVVGDVTIGPDCYIGHGAILRGDYGTIIVGAATAIEEGVIVHARPQDRTVIGQRVTVGHGAMIHNATVHDGATIGMRAVVSDFAVVGEGALIGELSLVKRGQQVPARAIAVGSPARVIGEVGAEQSDMAVWAKELYVELARRYDAALREISRDQVRSPDASEPA